MSENTFHQLAHEHLKEEVNVVTTQGSFEGRLLHVGTDIIVLENRMMRQRPLRLIIRIAEIVVLFRAELAPRGPFGFMPQEFEEHHESQDH
ncbi:MULTISPECIES: DUF2642 domain-containing protein [Bacillaceae]|uniref:DUF2642 domain-containing protein n=1 Tax=Bacillaceae TaxID=186817 RepID=UPI002FFF3AB6